MPKYYFTFGPNHHDADGRSLHFRYCVIEADDEAKARHVMSERRGLRWAFTYLTPQDAGVADFGLREISLEDATLEDAASAYYGPREISLEDVTLPAEMRSIDDEFPVVPRTFLVGVTQPDLDGIDEFLAATGNEDFMTPFREAVNEHGPVCLCSMYAKMCYRSLTVGKNANVRAVRDIEDNVIGTLSQGHGAVFEHVWLNFVTVNCSRVFTHELVRHRVGTAFSQTSGRYCTPESAQMVLPPEFETVSVDDTTLADAYRAMLEELKEFVAAMRLGLGVDEMPMAERKRWTSALRRIMPSGADNEMGWSVNVRSLRHLIELRTSPHAEWEIRRVFTDVARLVEKRWPLMLHGGAKTTDAATDLDEWTGLRV